MGRGNFAEVRDGLWVPLRGLGRVGRPSKRSGTIWGILGEVWDGL